MSRNFQGKNKDLVKLNVVDSKDVWTKNKTGKPVLRRDIDIYGRIDKGTSAMITTTNLVGENHKFVEDTNKLPKNLKNKIVNSFKNNKKRVVYLVKKR